MNRKLYAIFLAAVVLALIFLMGCGGSSHKTTTTPPPPATTPYAFYLSGQEEINQGPNYYALAGAVTIDASGNVTAGEQDYNDAFGNTSVGEPATGDSITGGTLTVDATGQGTLTLTTNNSAVGVSGTETLAVQFVNANHALITQFDGSATSSGSMDLQTALSSAPSGSFAFTMSGVDPNYNPVAFGGVFTLPSAATDEVDVNDAGTVQTALPLTVSLGTPDAFGRGAVTSSAAYGTPPVLIAFNYYIVGPEAIRIIDVDASDAAVGSAFGQGTSAGTFTNASLTAAVFAVSGDPFGVEYGVAGQISPGAAIYSGVAEDVELDTAFTSGLASTISGSYAIAANGYGNITVAGFGGGNVHNMQLYATDPTLNLNDPNNTQTDVGGALLLDVDAALAGGLGVAVAQTDTTSTDFSGNYAAGWQNFNDFIACTDCEFDMVANGTMTSGGAFSLPEAEVSDPFQTLAAGGAFGPGTFTGTPTPDPNPLNAGRLTMLSTDAAPGGPLTSSIGAVTPSFDVVMYQASATELFWLEYDNNSVFVGPIEAQGSLTGVPAVAHAAKAQAKRK